MHVFSSVADLTGAVGRELGTGDWLEIDQLRIEDFADTTEDWEWIHVDVARASAGPFGATIAHGYLTLSLLPRLTQTIYRMEGVSLAVNYGVDAVRFLTPVRVGSRIRARATLVGAQVREVNAVKVSIATVVELADEDKPACVATTTGLFAF